MVVGAVGVELLLGEAASHHIVGVAFPKILGHLIKEAVGPVAVVVDSTITDLHITIMVPIVLLLPDMVCFLHSLHQN